MQEGKSLKPRNLPTKFLITHLLFICFMPSRQKRSLQKHYQFLKNVSKRKGEAFNDRTISTGSPDLQAWVQRAAKHFDEIVRNYSGAKLARLEQDVRGRKESEAGDPGLSGESASAGGPRANGSGTFIRPNGNIGLVHWSNTGGLKTLDPYRHGKNLPKNAFKEK